MWKGALSSFVSSQRTSFMIGGKQTPYDCSSFSHWRILLIYSHKGKAYLHKPSQAIIMPLVFVSYVLWLSGISPIWVPAVGITEIMTPLKGKLSSKWKPWCKTPGVEPHLLQRYLCYCHPSLAETTKSQQQHPTTKVLQGSSPLRPSHPAKQLPRSAPMVPEKWQCPPCVVDVLPQRGPFQKTRQLASEKPIHSSVHWSDLCIY